MLPDCKSSSSGLGDRCRALLNSICIPLCVYTLLSKLEMFFIFIMFSDCFAIIYWYINTIPEIKCKDDVTHHPINTTFTSL